MDFLQDYRWSVEAEVGECAEADVAVADELGWVGGRVEEEELVVDEASVVVDVEVGEVAEVAIVGMFPH